MKSFLMMGLAMLLIVANVALLSMLYALPAMLGIWLWSLVF